MASDSSHKLIYVQPPILRADVSSILKTQLKKPAVDQATANRILASFPYERGFHFFSDVGKYTGETAVNLFSFLEELRTIEPQSLRFHFERRDFQKWIAETLGDQTLAERISGLNAKASDENLKRELLRTVQTRFEELQTISQTP